MKKRFIMCVAIIGTMLSSTSVFASELTPGTVIPMELTQNYSTRSITYSEQITESDGDYVAYFNVDHSFRFYIRNDSDSDLDFTCYSADGDEIGLPYVTLEPGDDYTSMWVAASYNSTYHIALSTTDGGELDAFLRVRESDV